jgi:hypothetical protein
VTNIWLKCPGNGDNLKESLTAANSASIAAGEAGQKMYEELQKRIQKGDKLSPEKIKEIGNGDAKLTKLLDKIVANLDSGGVLAQFEPVPDCKEMKSEIDVNRTAEKTGLPTGAYAKIFPLPGSYLDVGAKIPNPPSRTRNSAKIAFARDEHEKVLPPFPAGTEIQGAHLIAVSFGGDDTLDNIIPTSSKINAVFTACEDGIAKIARVCKKTVEYRVVISRVEYDETTKKATAFPSFEIKIYVQNQKKPYYELSCPNISSADSNDCKATGGLPGGKKPCHNVFRITD